MVIAGACAVWDQGSRGCHLRRGRIAKFPQSGKHGISHGLHHRHCHLKDVHSYGRCNTKSFRFESTSSPPRVCLECASLSRSPAAPVFPSFFLVRQMSHLATSSHITRHTFTSK